MSERLKGGDRSTSFSSLSDIDEARRVRDRVRSLARRHESIMQAFWNPGRGTFGLETSADSQDHVTTACTAALSFADLPVSRLPAFFHREGFVQWLLAADWKSEELAEHNVYTAPIALAALASLDRDRLREPKPEEAFRFLVNELNQPRSDRSGGVCYQEYPPNGFLTYWALRGVWDALSVYEEQGWSDNRRHDDELQRARVGITRATRWAADEAYRQFAYFAMQDLDHFDPLQMAYAVALVDFDREKGRLDPDRKMVGQTLEILFQSQLPNGLWPKGNPIFHYSRLGSVYPFSFETLTAIMRIGFRAASQSAAAFSVEFFRPYLPSLLRTLDWAESHELRTRATTGWRSNHVLPGESPHAWATAMVLSFGEGLDALLHQVTREQILTEFGALSVGEPESIAVDSETWTKLVDSDITFPNGQPGTLKGFLFTRLIKPHLEKSEGRVWSAVFCGPPGTAKTRLAREIAHALGWPLVVVQTSDFLAQGEDRMAYQARLIFRKLEHLSETVVLIDEVDEFVRERKDETAPGSRLITTAMLTLLQELRERECVILILATNYIQKFDRAILRPGRFDLVLTVLPPNFEAKMAMLNERLASQQPSQASSLEQLLKEQQMSELVERFTHAEWQTLLRTVESEDGRLLDSGAFAALIKARAAELTIRRDEWSKWKKRRTQLNV